MTPSPIDRSAAVAAAAAHDLNDEMTIAISGLMLAIEGRDASQLPQALAACQRVAWKSATLLSYAGRRGVRPTAATAEAVVDLFEMGLQ